MMLLLSTVKTEFLWILEPLIFKKQEQFYPSSLSRHRVLCSGLGSAAVLTLKLKSWAGNSVSSANNWKFCFNKVLRHSLSALISQSSNVCEIIFRFAQ